MSVIAKEIVVTCTSLDEFLTVPLQIHCRNLPLSTAPLSIRDIAKRKWQALDGDLLFPLLLLKEAALANNIALMADFCREAGVLHAPHAKTPMSPQLVWRLLDSGAWGTSIATIDQARVLRRFGVNRLLMVNQLLEEQSLAWIAQELDRDETFEFWCLVDSTASVELMDDVLARSFATRKVNVLIELGVGGGRAGCRDTDATMAVARAVAATRHLELAGLELYEAMAATGATLDVKLAAVDAVIQSVHQGLRRLLAAGLLDSSQEIILTAGGSLYFDRVVAAFSGGLEEAPQAKIVLRGGCVVTHEIGENDCLSPLAGRRPRRETLQQALELWGMVLSRPEPDLAIVNFGKRDTSFDKGLPVPFAIRPRGRNRQLLDSGFEVLSLNDHHARVAVPVNCSLAPGDLVGCHIAHPCTAFDKWRLVPVVDDTYRVLDAIVTFF